MSALWLAAALSVAPVQTAETVPHRALMLHIDGGLALIDIDLPPVPAVYMMTGELGVAYGLWPGVDVRGRYTTTLGLIHRVGPELRARLLSVGRLAAALRLHPSLQFAGAAREQLNFGGDLSTLSTLMVSHRAGFGAFTGEAGVTVQWLLFEDIRGRSFVDDEPYLAYVELSFGYEWATGPRSNLSMRLELSVPTAPDDPFTVLGALPRLLFGGSWSL